MDLYNGTLSSYLDKIFKKIKIMMLLFMSMMTDILLIKNYNMKLI